MAKSNSNKRDDPPIKSKEELAEIIKDPTAVSRILRFQYLNQNQNQYMDTDTGGLDSLDMELACVAWIDFYKAESQNTDPKLIALQKQLQSSINHEMILRSDKTPLHQQQENIRYTEECLKTLKDEGEVIIYY